MKKNKIIIIITIILILISFYLQYGFLGHLKIDINFLTSLITFLSIMFGFYITSFSIFSTSHFVSDLYKKEDAATGKTLLHTLIEQYRIGLILNLFSILYFLMLTFYITQSIEIFLNFSDLITYLTIPLLIFIMIYNFKMLDNLIKIIRQESKNKN